MSSKTKLPAILRNHKANIYALDNGEIPDTMDYLTTVQDFQNGYNEGFKEAVEIKKQLHEAKKLLRETYRLPQNQKWNYLYQAGTTIRNKISEFLIK